jgi:hypothetical protein
MLWMLASLKASEWAAVAAFVGVAMVLYAATHSSRMSRRSSEEARAA